jgi:poly-gamma-glutamate capsule biosynthesis protein CapA/YwtB (metallophosphatase superfamily)
MPERYSSVLRKAGFDFLCLANNHFSDFGWPAVSRTTTILDSLGIKYAGPVEHKYAIVEKDSVRFGFCAFSTTAGAIDMNDTAWCGSVVRELSSKCDIVIVSFHGGAEGEEFQHVTRRNEIFYGEDRGNVYTFTHHMIDCGADVVFGHGPHVSRAIEIYKERLICYSLGNFCTYGRFNILGPNGFSPIVKVKVDKRGKFVSGKIIPVIQDQDGSVRFDPQRKAVRRIKELITSDFPEARFSVFDDGRILNN